MTDEKQHPAPVILITGAAAGIGLAIAEHLVASNHRVIAVDVDGAALDTAYGSHSQDSVLRVVADISSTEGAQRCVDAGVARFGRLDSLVNNAALHGKPWLKPCLEYSSEDWHRLFSVNVFAIATMAKAAREALAQSGGSIVNISSMVGYGYGSPSPYSVSKAALNGMTIALAGELGALGIRVVGLAPGFITTPTVLAAMGQEARDRVMAAQAVRTTGTPEDIAAIVAFLVSPQARLIAGTTIMADLGIIRRP